MMQSCASAAKLRSGGPILPFGLKPRGVSGFRHLEPLSASRHERTRPKLSGCLQRPPFIVPHAKRRPPGQCPPARTATGRSVACAPRPRSWAFEYREHSRCGRDDDQRRARFRARINRATTLYSVGPRTRTMMQILCRRDGREVCYRLGFYLPTSA
jgi:hypothetical protein